MKRGDLSKLLLPLIALAAIGINGAASAQTYPNRPIRLVVPYAAGGSVDTIARVIGAKLADNHRGSPSSWKTVPARAAIPGPTWSPRSPPDGYTMLLAAGGLAISGALYKTLPFDPVKDFAPSDAGGRVGLSSCWRARRSRRRRICAS